MARKYSKILTIRLSPSEFELIQKASAEEGWTVGNFMRTGAKSLLNDLVENYQKTEQETI